MAIDAMPYALDAGGGDAHWFFGSLVTLKAVPEDTGGAFALTEFINPAGFASPLHVHHDEHEAFYILEGRAHVHCGTDAFAAGPGSFVMLPKGVPHWHQVDADGPLRCLVLTTGHFDKYVAACGEPADTRERPPASIPDMERAIAAGERFRIEILGPPPASPLR